MRDAIFPVIGMLYALGNFAAFGEGIDWTQSAGVGKGREGIVGACVLGFMEGFVRAPTPLKAVLRTEEAVFYAQLETGRTLQSPGIIVAIEADTFALGCFRAHIGGIASAEDSRRLTR